MPIHKRMPPPKPLKTYRDLLDLVESRRGVVNVEMWELRDIHGAGKLGVHVTKNISDRLASFGLGHFPEELPQHQGEFVRVFVRGSAVGKLIDAALTVDTPSNRLLREAAHNEDRENIRKIRELVCP